MKLHGSIEESSKFILTKEQYNNAYGVNSEESIDFSNSFVGNLGRVMISKTLLFLGCSLKNDRTLHILKSIIQHFGNKIKHYAFLQLEDNEDNNILLERKLNKYGISVIWFPKGEFGAIKTLLEHLQQSKNDVVNRINTLPKVDINFMGRNKEVEEIKKK